jgi:hypothetical protein
MKKKVKKNAKLKLSKLTIARLDNLKMIKGGGNSDDSPNDTVDSPIFWKDVEN